MAVCGTSLTKTVRTLVDWSTSATMTQTSSMLTGMAGVARAGSAACTSATTLVAVPSTMKTTKTVKILEKKSGSAIMTRMVSMRMVMAGAAKAGSSRNL